MPTGTCKLCLLKKDLRDSHLMPRSLYKKSRNPAAKGNQDPLLVTKASRKPTSHQITDYVFCKDCEHLFNVNGEDYVMRLVAKVNGDFPLLKMLKATPPAAKGAEWETYSEASTPTINRDKIGYFVISVFWRASVHTWEHENGEKVRIDLGKKYNEEIRTYLLGQTIVPASASLQVFVCSDILNQSTFFTPTENQKHKDRTFTFVARGMLFFFRVSNTLTGFQRRLSIVNNPNRWITIRDCGHKAVWTVG
jgi:hypothetical protein